MRTAYISGPMTGYVEHNYPTFNHIADTLNLQGWNVYNPAGHFGGDHDRARSEYLRADTQDILRVDTFVLLPDWQTSPGALLEVTLAYNLGVRDFFTWDFDSDRPVAVGFEDHVRPFLCDDYFPDHDPNHQAPDGTKQPDAWKEGPADLDPGPDQTILEEAQSLTRGDRQAAYGHPMSDFTCMGNITQAILSRYYESEGYALVRVEDDGSWEEPSEGPMQLPRIPARISTMLMQAVKLSREAAKPKRDNRVDGAGYWDTTQMACEADPSVDKA
jgi:hypothetical protein